MQEPRWASHSAWSPDTGTAVADRCVDLRNGWGKSVGDWPPSADGDVTFGLASLRDFEQKIVP